MTAALPIPTAKSRYALLAQSLLERINGGDYPIGSLLPTEFELCRQFGVSRTTVREAIRFLSDMGMVSRKAGVGTHVRAKYTSPKYVHAIESISDIFQYTMASAKPVLLASEEIEAGEDDAELLRCQTGQRWIMFETVRSFASNGVPMVRSRAYVPPEYAGIVKQVPGRREPMYTLIEREYGQPVVEVQQEFSARQVGAREARILKVKAGSAGLHVTRHYFGESDRLLLVTLSLYPSDRFSYAMRLRHSRKANKEQVE
jgi:DNA-binding GntR family transcriptional regulator